MPERGEAWVREKLRNPRATNAASIMPVLPLTEAEIDALVQYLWSIGRPADIVLDGPIP